MSDKTSTKHPDLDNIVKAIKDGATGVTWKNDAQGADRRASKRYGTSRVEMKVSSTILARRCAT